MANVFLTGASGFLGSHLAVRLIQDGHSVTAAVRSSSSTVNIPEECSIVRVDFLDSSCLASHLADVSLIYHIAGATKGRSREEFDLANAGVTRALVKAAEEACPDALFVLASSQSASGPSASGPVSCYGASKLLAEKAASVMGRWIVVRPPAVIGPLDPAARPLFRLAAKGLFVSPANRGGFALVFVDDLVRLFASLPAIPAAVGRILQPSYNELYTWKAFHALLEKAAGRRILHLRIPAFLLRLAGHTSEMVSLFTRENRMITREKVREFLCCEWVLDRGFTEDLTGWRPEVPIEDAVARTLEWAISCNPTA